MDVFEAILGAHEKVGTIRYGESTAGSTILLNDQTESTAHADDQFNNGTIFFIDGSSGVDHQYRRITDYDASSGQFTFTTLSTAVGDGVTYGVATPEFPITMMERLTNSALRSLGPLVYSARAIQSSGNQRVFTLSTSLAVAGSGSLGKFSKPFRIDIQTDIGSSGDDPGWEPIGNWDIEPTTAGDGLKIIFNDYLPNSRDIRVWYEDHHAELTASTQRIDERLHPELVVLAIVDKMYEYRNSRARGAQEFDVQRWNDAKRQLAEARVRWPVWRPKRKPDITIIRGGSRSQSMAPPYGGGLE